MSVALKRRLVWLENRTPMTVELVLAWLETLRGREGIEDYLRSLSLGIIEEVTARLENL